MELIRVHPRDVDVSGPWLFWARQPGPELASSLAGLGQIVPVLADFTPDKPRLVAGYSRVMAMRGVKGATLLAQPVSLASGEGEDEDREPLPDEVRFGLSYLASNLERRPDDAMLVAAGRYFAARLPFAEAIRLAGPYLGLGPRDRRTRDLAAWLALPGRFDALLAAGSVTLASAPDLAGLGEELTAVEPFLGAVRWSRNALRNVLTFLGEAALARGESLAAAVSRAGLAAFLDMGLSPNDLTARLQGAARTARYPRLTGLERRFAGLSGELARGTRLRLSASQGFETDAVRLTADIKSRADLDRLLADLALAAARPQWEQLWSLVRDAEDGHDG